MKILHSFGMPSIEVMLPLDTFKSLMVRMEYKFSSYEIINPMF